MFYRFTKNINFIVSDCSQSEQERLDLSPIWVSRLSLILALKQPQFFTTALIKAMKGHMKTLDALSIFIRGWIFVAVAMF